MPTRQRDGADQADTVSKTFGIGYGYVDYGATCYVDISPVLSTAGTGGGVGTPTPYRDKATRSNGMLKQGKTAIAEVVDGLSNTIAIGEDAGRDEYFLSPYTELPGNGSKPFSGGDTRGLGPYSAAAARRYWRWAEPDSAYGVSGQPNNKYRPMKETGPYQPFPGALGTAGNNAGLNDELGSFHSGGINCLFGDGHVAFIKDTINLITLRAIVTPNGGEVVSADQY